MYVLDKKNHILLFYSNQCVTKQIIAITLLKVIKRYKQNVEVYEIYGKNVVEMRVVLLLSRKVRIKSENFSILYHILGISII